MVAWKIWKLITGFNGSRKKKLTVERFDMNWMVAWKIWKLITGFNGSRKGQRGFWKGGRGWGRV